MIALRMRRSLTWMALMGALSAVEGGGAVCEGEADWRELPPLPDRTGFAGSFAGVSGGALIVAGGANFPDRPPWEGGTKVWHDRVFVLERPDGRWIEGFRLARPLGYGVSVSHATGIVCAGGSDAAGHHREVFRLRWEGGAVRSEALADLPQPCANMCGALMGDVLYIAGGIDAPAAAVALRVFWALDLSRPDARWRELEPWPGAERMLAVAGAQDGSFFLFGGAALEAGPDGKPSRRWLRDAHRYTPGKGWRRIADLPRACVAAPSPAAAVGNSRLLVFGGDDGGQLCTPPMEHRGFPRDVLCYDTISDTWTRAGEVPFSLVTTCATEWRGRIVVSGGESRPGVRSPAVWWAGLGSGKGTP